MNEDQILKLLPPILLGFGGVVPLLITSNPFSIPKAIRVLLSAILALITWIGYGVAFFLGQYYFFADWITALFLIMSLIFLVIVFTNLRHDPNNSEKASPLLVWYSFALLSISVAAGNYVGPNGYVILDFKAPFPIISVSRLDTGSSEYSVSATSYGSGKSAFIEKTAFDSTRKFIIHYDNDTNARITSNFFQQEATLGLGQRYLIDARYDTNAPH